MNILKKFLRTSYDHMKKQTNVEGLEYYYGYCKGFIMSMYATDIISYDNYDTYTNFIDRVYKEYLEDLRNNG